MLTFHQLQEKKTKVKINPNVKDQYESTEKKHKDDCECQKCEDKKEGPVVEASSVLDANTKIKKDKARKKDEAKLAKLTHIYKGMKTGQYNSYEPEGEFMDEERSARKMNVRTKGTIKKQIAKDAAAEAKRREKKTGEYKETPKRKPRLKKPSQLTTVKAEPKKAKPKAKPVAAVKKVAPKPKAKPAAKKKAPAKKPAAKKVAPKKAAPKVDKKAADIDRPKGNLTDKARDWVKRGVKRHRKATQGARVFAKGAAKGAKDTVKFAGKVKKVFTGEELMSFKAYLLSEGYELKEYSPNVSYQAKGGKKSGKLGKSSVYSLRGKDESKKDFRKSHTKDIKDGLLKKEEVEIDEGIGRAIKKGVKIAKRVAKDMGPYDPGGSHTIGTLGTPHLGNEDKRAKERAAKKKGVKEEIEIDEATRLKKEKGYDKGGTKKAPSPVMQAVIAKIEKEHGKGSIAGRTQQKKKVKGAKSTEGTGKYLKRAKEKAAYAAKAKKAGFKSTQAYTDTVARYGGESNYKKGKGLGT